MDNYRLVDCDFYDELEALATLRQQCQIIYYKSAFLQKTNSSASKIFVLFGSGSFFLSYLSGTLTFLLLEQNLQLLEG